MPERRLFSAREIPDYSRWNIAARERQIVSLRHIHLRPVGRVVNTATTELKPRKMVS